MPENISIPFVLLLVDFCHLFLSCLCKSMIFVWFGRSYKKIDEGVGNQVSNPWCRECLWDYVSPVLAITKL